MDVYLVNNDNKAARSLMVKMAGEKKAGEMIPCTAEEMTAFKNGDFVKLTSSTKRDTEFVPVDPDLCYVAVVNDNTTNIDDVVMLRDMLLPRLGVVRTIA